MCCLWGWGGGCGVGYGPFRGGGGVGRGSDGGDGMGEADAGCHGEVGGIRQEIGVEFSSGGVVRCPCMKISSTGYQSASEGAANLLEMESL